MELKDLYTNINNNTVDNSLIIFKNPKSSDFIANQYIDEIAKQHNLIRISIEDLSEVKVTTTIFDTFSQGYLEVYTTQKLDYADSNLIKAKNLIICCNTISKAAEKLYTNYIVEIPELAEWQLKDYLYSSLSGMSEESLEELFNYCNKDPYRIKTEIERLNIFPEVDRNMMFQKFKLDNIYTDSYSDLNFKLSDAIIYNDIEALKNLYQNAVNEGFTALDIVGLLKSKYKIYINLITSRNPDPNDCGTSPGAFRFLKQKVDQLRFEGKALNAKQLMKIYLILTDIDKQIKLGLLDSAISLDYLLVNILDC